MEKIRSIILAAGKGTRMKSDLPKVLHNVHGKPMVLFAVETLQEVTGSLPILVVGYGAEQVKRVVGDRAEYVYQGEQLGTGHAVQQAKSRLMDRTEFVLVTSADMPLLSKETLSTLVTTQMENSGPLTMLTVVADDPRGFGRVVRDAEGYVKAIIEEPDASPDVLAIKELNAGAYCFRGNWLWDNLSRLPISSKGEYYLTDMVGIAVKDGLEVRAISTTDNIEAIGINTIEHLTEVEKVIQQRITGIPKGRVTR